jgi:hypothetical protein
VVGRDKEVVWCTDLFKSFGCDEGRVRGSPRESDTTCDRCDSRRILHYRSRALGLTLMDIAERIHAVSRFLLQSPPGEINDVLNGARDLYTPCLNLLGRI